MAAVTMPQATPPIIESGSTLEKDPNPSSFLSPNRDTEHGLEHSTVSRIDTPIEKSQPNGGEHEQPPRTVKGFVWALVVLAILLSTFLFALDNTVLQVAA